MTIFALNGIRRMGIWGLSALLIVLFVQAVWAQTSGRQTQERGPKNAVSGLTRAVASGIKAFKEGDTSVAISTFTDVLLSGGLTTKDMAQAFYYRGLAYEKKKKTVRSIADLTTALWFSNGLTQQERSRAELVRSRSYRQNNLDNPEESDPAGTENQWKPKIKTNW